MKTMKKRVKYDGHGPKMAWRASKTMAFLVIFRWPIFKTVANAECPLGGLAIATVMRWRCLSGTWKDLAEPDLEQVFACFLVFSPCLIMFHIFSWFVTVCFLFL